MKDLDIGVKLLANAVTDECSHHSVAMFFCVVLDSSTDIADRSAWFDSFNAKPGAFFRHPDEITARLVNLTNTEGCIGVAVHATDKPGDIKVHDVSITHHP